MINIRNTYFVIDRNLGNLVKWHYKPSLWKLYFSLKLNVMPRFIYWIQSLPAGLPKSFCKKYNFFVGIFLPSIKQPLSVFPNTLITLKSTLTLPLPYLFFRFWAQRGIKQIKDLYQGDTLTSSGDLEVSYQSLAIHFFRFLQITIFYTV